MCIIKIETNFKRKLFWDIHNLQFTGKRNHIEKELINLYPDTVFQNIIGFGGAFTESAGYCLAQVNKLIANNILDDYFSNTGLEYSLCRTHIGSCDFSLSPYSYLDTPDINSFSINRDKKYLIPMIKSAIHKNANLQLLASPWSPPAFMKDTNKLTLGGKLLEKNYELYAEYLSRYILEYQKNGIDIKYLTIQNEPNVTQSWESCLYSVEEEAKFAEYFLYPKFLKDGIKTQILAWDHNKEMLYERSKNTFEIAKNSISGMAMHWYSGDYFEEIALTRNQFSDKLLVHTEGCTGYSNFRKEDEIKNAEIYGHDILNDLNAGINGFIDWNIVLRL